MVQPRELGRVSRTRARWRSKLSIGLALSLAALLPACGHDPAHAGVALLPDNTKTGETWDWTAACPFAPHGPSGCQGSGPNLGSAQLEEDAWNLGRGPVSMSVTSAGALAVKGNLPSAPPCTRSTCTAPSANTWVRGYPSVLYGINQCRATSSPPYSPKLPLPQEVGAIPSDLVGTTAYGATDPHATYDVAYDLWLSGSGTKNPCRTNGTIEVMIWTDYNAKALLPESVKVATASLPFAVDGDAHPGDQAWSVYATNVYRAGQTVPWGGTVWIVLNQNDIVSKGKVSVDLSSALSVVGELLQNNYGWSDFAGHYWLDTIAFGTEFGPESGDPYGAGPTQFSLNLTSYCLGVKTTVSKPAC